MACDAPPGWWCNGTRYERVAVARSFLHPPPASADRVSPPQKRRVLSTSPLSTSSKTPPAPLPLPPSSPPASPNTWRNLAPSFPPGLAPSFPPTLPHELTLHIDDVPTLSGRGPGSEHFSSFMQGVGLSTALFFTLALVYILNRYRRWRQRQQRLERRRRRQAQARELYDASIGQGTTDTAGNPIVDSPEAEMSEAEMQHELLLLRARATAIDALPKRTVAQSEVADAAAEPLECSICLGDLAAGDKLSQLPCGHEFHGPCTAA